MSDWERAAAYPEILRQLNVPLPPRHSLATTKAVETDYRVDSELSLVREDVATRFIPSRLVEVDTDQEEANSLAETLHPWRRFFARQIDLWFLVAAFSFVLGLFGSSSTLDKLFENNAIASVVSVLMLIPVEAFFLGMFGATLGKA